MWIMTNANKTFPGALTALFSASMVATTSLALAQEPVQVCETQQQLEQVYDSDGQSTPDGCRTVTVTRVTSDHGPLCMVDLNGDEGLLDTLRGAALTLQWWASCDDLIAAIGDEP